MIILDVVLKAYLIMTFTTAIDEIYNIHNPRPYPKQIYYTVQWEELDFIKVNNKWKLRSFRESDNKYKKYIRDKYRSENGRSKR